MRTTKDQAAKEEEELVTRVTQFKKELDENVRKVEDEQARNSRDLMKAYRKALAPVESATHVRENNLGIDLTRAERYLKRYLAKLDGKIHAQVIQLVTQDVPQAKTVVAKAEDVVTSANKKMQQETAALLAKNTADLQKALTAGAQILEGEMAVKAGTQARDVAAYKAAAGSQIASAFEKVAGVGHDLTRSVQDLETKAESTRKRLTALQGKALQVKEEQQKQFKPVYDEINADTNQYLPETVAKVQAALDAGAKAFRSHVKKRLNQLGVQDARQFSTDLAERHDEIDRLAVAVDKAADAKQAELDAVDGPVEHALSKLQEQEDQLQLRLQYAAGNESAIRSAIMEATRQEHGLVSTTDMLLRSSADAQKELLTKKAKDIASQITATAGNLSTEVQAQVAAVADGAAAEMAAVMADVELSESAKRRKLAKIDADMRATMEEISGVVLSNNAGLLSFEEAENAWGVAMTEEDRKLARLLRKAHSARLSEVAAEKKNLARESDRLNQFVKMITAEVGRLWKVEGKQLSAAQSKALANLRSLDQRTAKATELRVLAAQKAEKLAQKVQLVAAAADTMTKERLETITGEIDQEFVDMEEGNKEIKRSMYDMEAVRKAAIKASRAFTASSTEPTLAHVLTVAEVLDRAARGTAQNQLALDKQQKEFRLSIETLLQELLDEERGAAGAALDDARAEDDVVWHAGEFQKRIGDQLMQSEKEAQAAITAMGKQFEGAVAEESKESSGKYQEARAAIKAATETIEHSVDGAAKEGQALANQIISSGDAWDNSVGQSIAKRTVEQNHEAQKVAEATESRVRKLGNDDTQIVHAAKQLQSQIEGDVRSATAIGVYLERYGLRRQKETEQARANALATIERLKEKAEKRAAGSSPPVLQKLEKEEGETALLEQRNAEDRKELASLLGA